MRRVLFVGLIIVGMFVLFGCGAFSDEASVTGNVTYLQRIALPDDAVVTVQIQDTSRQDVAAEVIGEQVIETEGQQVPISYEVSYDPDVIEDNHTYTMSARITDGEGNLLFINDTAIPVITRDSPTEDVEILVVQTGG
jgi:putative lipoprotein